MLNRCRSSGTLGGALSFHVSLDNGDSSENIGDGASLGVAYDAGTFNVVLGWEDDQGDTSGYLGLGVDVGSVGLAAVVRSNDDGADGYALSADFVAGATTFTVFMSHKEGGPHGDRDAWGLGLSHDLGGGASLEAGMVDVDNDAGGFGEIIYDFGISMTF